MASKKIRGITVEIGGDTTKLGKAFEQSEKQSRSLQVELKQIEKLLKFDPTNTELLIQKQNVLADMISETSKKLNTMKEAEAQVIAQFERGEIAEDQLRAFQREIMQTEKDLGDMQAELRTATRNLEEFGDNNGVAKEATAKLEKEIREQNEALEAEKKALKEAEQAQKDHEKAVKEAKEELADFKEKASGAFDSVKTGATVVGGAVIATGGYALKLSTDFDKAFNTLVTKTGVAENTFEDLNEIMETIYANNFGESIEDVAESMALVKNNMKLTNDEMQGATESALLMRDVFDFDVNESTRTAKMLMDQYGMSAEEAYNLIAQGAQNGLDKNGDLLDTINEYSVHFNGLGLSAEDMFNMLVSGAENGTFSVDKLGDAVKEFGIRVKDESDATVEAFGKLGLDADKMSDKFGKGGESAKQALQETTTALFNMKDPIEQNQVGVALFGTMWEDLGAEGVKALMDTRGEIDRTNGALKTINEQKYDDIGSALQGLGRTLETDVVKPLGEELKPVVEDAIGYVKENGPQIKEVLSDIVKKIGEFVGFVVNNGPTILSVIGGIGAGFVTWKVASMINGVVGAIKAFKLANEGATVAQWAMNVAMNANPIGLIITAIVALVTTFILLWKNCEGFRNFWIGLWEGIKSVFNIVVQWFKETIPKIGEFFVNLWNGIVNIFASVGTWFNDHVIQPIINIFNVIIAWIRTHIITPIANFYSKWIAPVVNKLIEIVRKLVEIVVALFVGLWNLLRENVINPIVNGFKSLWSKVSGFFKSLWSDVVAIWNKVSSWFNSNVIQPVVNIFKSLWSKLSSGAKSAWSGIKSVFSSVKSWFSSIFSGAWTAVKNVFSSWGSFFSGLWNKIKSTFSKLGSSIANAIGGAVKSGINGVISLIQNTINGAISLINGAISLINKLPGVSVSKISKLSLPRLAQGGIVDSPTIAEIGENGREAIIPLEKNTGWLREVGKELSGHLSGGVANAEVLDKLDGIYERLGRLQMVTETGALVGEILDKIDAGLAEKQALSARGV